MGGAVGSVASVVIKSNVAPDITINSSGGSGGSDPLSVVGNWLANGLGSLAKPAVYVGAVGQEVKIAAPYGDPTPNVWIAVVIGIVLLWLLSLALAVAVAS